ncbi:MAG TPA: flagellar hook capping FlgD N-terminal domain-containing protein [Amaricoccus sp.]|uniref:flagellar hook capping FlgD N-terminal domain-containing protein n=1 Tax=Amaricoccus sp. TaxID=1872485 RepID=UPI002CDDBAB1|nr:flagellar hook capping FlgD N-terminal domain-containing protein [Amaricoccus sp.]HMR53502.1 flagellar hook capping FlgD N-terminal domain-containing protein [Amaricoccus sp.]HMR62355.1 flagellar hook capping FlgD N-terminal domain-containing protein [Amaricoccus sp.]HMU00440.1 flagellar hook capping FlgD N-terminal domain-containing protein [Amaricoccus sp.]
MNVTPTSAASAAATTAASTKSEKAETPNAMAGDFQTFLTLLTTQMRNQDPLKPMESTEFVAQLASFSGVEQQIRANDRLDRIFEVLSGGSAGGLAAWVGREIRAPGKADFTGEPIDVARTPVPDTDSAVLVVKNDFGQEVARRAIDPLATNVAWDGQDGYGAPAAHGRYSFTIESFAGETLADRQEGSVFARVSEVRLAEDGPVLLTEGGGSVALAEVTGIR